MKLDQNLVDAAINFLKIRFPDGEDWKGAAAMYTESGKIILVGPKC